MDAFNAAHPVTEAKPPHLKIVVLSSSNRQFGVGSISVSELMTTYEEEDDKHRDDDVESTNGEKKTMLVCLGGLERRRARGKEKKKRENEIEDARKKCKNDLGF